MYSAQLTYVLLTLHGTYMIRRGSIKLYFPTSQKIHVVGYFSNIICGVGILSLDHFPPRLTTDQVRLTFVDYPI